MKPFYKTFLLLFLNSLLLVFNSYGQGENNIWYFGYYAGLDFNSGIPVPLTNGQMNQWEGVATISDSAGNLLFYTDGMTVWNRNHQVMPNGIGLAGDNSSTQSATIVQVPGSSTQYYIFTVPPNSSTGNFCFSIVDITLDSGFGDVTTKNYILHSSSSEKCIALYKTGTSDVWVIAHSTDTIFYSYLVTPTGINPPVLSSNQLYTCAYNVGYMKASPRGNKNASAIYCATTSNFALYDFDCSSGIVSNEMVISVGNPGGIYGIEFSPDGTKLYVVPWMVTGGSTTYILQYDITLGSAAAIAASKDTIGNISQPGVGDAQIGPDQKIYISKNNGDSLAVINDPNLPGLSCGFVENAVYLGGSLSGIGLPALIRGSICNTIGINENTTVINNITISPNPSSGILQITLPSSNQKTNYTLEVINTLGQTVFATQPETRNKKQETQLDLSFLPKGMYVLKINDGLNPLTKLFIIQ